MLYDIVGQASVVTERGLLAHESLIDPLVKYFPHN